MNVTVFHILLALFLLPSNAYKCGQFKFNSALVVNGYDTARGEFPFLIALVNVEKQKIFCAANLISQRHALTAAHCMHEKYRENALQPAEVLALLGKYNLDVKYETGVVPMDINNITIHEDWKVNDPGFDADIALLFFARQAELSTFIKIICLPLSWHASVLKEGQVVGWGSSERTKFGELENIPRKVQMKKPPTNEYCFLREKDVSDSSNRTFCAEGENSGPCVGDSGGGFYIVSNSVLILQGLVSSSKLTNSMECNVTTYSIYTNVAHYVEWINEKINPVNPILMDCTFLDVHISQKSSYACYKTNTSITTDDFTFSTVVGNHLSGKSSRDVTLLVFRDNIDVRYIPRGISSVLPNLFRLYIQHANLTSLSRKGFERMKKVEIISLTSNQIEHIDEDTFYEVPKLSSLRINGNKLKSIPLNLFIHSNNLHYFIFHVNEIEHLNGEVFRNCPLLEVIDLNSNSLKNFVVDFSNFTFLHEVLLQHNVCINSNYIKHIKTPTLTQFQNMVDTQC